MDKKELNKYLNSILSNVEQGKLDLTPALLLILKTIKHTEKEQEQIILRQAKIINSFGDKLRVFQSKKQNIMYEAEDKKLIEDYIKKNKGVGLINYIERLIKQAKKDVLLEKDNQGIGCDLEAVANILRYRGYHKEAEELDNIASRIK